MHLQPIRHRSTMLEGCGRRCRLSLLFGALLLLRSRRSGRFSLSLLLFASLLFRALQLFRGIHLQSRCLLRLLTCSPHRFSIQCHMGLLSSISRLNGSNCSGLSGVHEQPDRAFQHRELRRQCANRRFLSQCCAPCRTDQLGGIHNSGRARCSRMVCYQGGFSRSLGRILQARSRLALNLLSRIGVVVDDCMLFCELLQNPCHRPCTLTRALGRRRYPRGLLYRSRRTRPRLYQPLRPLFDSIHARIAMTQCAHGVFPSTVRGLPHLFH
mmetsp:Transcript_4065/g.8356  ORF Transcript_4065/g.8356 Transcript_4065/m.8356 type:complete len:269 (+) Transcript_4065:730-1536(+)